MTMLQRKFEKRRVAQAGFSLFETFLAMTVGASLFLGVYVMSVSEADKVRDLQLAQHLLNVHAMAEGYVKDKFSVLWTAGFGEDIVALPGDALSNVGAVIEIPFHDEGLGWYLSEGVMPSGFSQVFPIRDQEIRVYVVNQGFMGDRIVFDIYTLTTTTGASSSEGLIGNGSLFRIARSGGPKVGTVSVLNNASLPACSVPVAKSVYGAWVFCPDMLSTVLAGDSLNPVIAATDKGGYLVAVSRVTLNNSVDGRYLHRMVVAGRPDLNRMSVPLNMNGYDLRNVRTLVADHVDVQGNAVISAAQGDLAMSVDGAMRVRGSGSVVAVEGNGLDGCELVDDNTDGLREWDSSAVGPCSAASLVGGVLDVKGQPAATADSSRTGVWVETLDLDRATITINDLTVSDQLKYTNGSAPVTVSSLDVDSWIRTGDLQAENMIVTGKFRTRNLEAGSVDLVDIDAKRTIIQTQMDVTGTLEAEKDFLVANGGNLTHAGTLSVDHDLEAPGIAQVLGSSECKTHITHDGIFEHLSGTEDCGP